jgi:hypothetical protein
MKKKDGHLAAKPFRGASTLGNTAGGACGAAPAASSVSLRKSRRKIFKRGSEPLKYAKTRIRLGEFCYSIAGMRE